MQRGLDGRRIALIAADDQDDAANAVIAALEGAGATVARPRSEAGEEHWHGGMYAALAVVGAPAPDERDRAQQLVREFLVADKPVAAHGPGLDVLLEAGGLTGRTVAARSEDRDRVSASGANGSGDAIVTDVNLVTAAPGTPVSEFADRTVHEFARLLEEHDVDEMSELSFPASDAPSMSPTSAGGAPRTGDKDSARDASGGKGPDR